MALWDYSTWSVCIQLGIILFSIIIGNVISRRVPVIKNTLVPASVVAGLLIFIVKFIPYVGDALIDSTFMENLTYHCLGLGFIAVALQTADKKKKSKTSVIVNSGIITVNGYLLQAILGLGLTLVLSITIFKDLFFASGLLLPMGYGQGTGQALNFGKVYEGMGFENGPAFGLSIAAVGFLVACIVGVIYLNVLKKKGKLDVQLARKDNSNDREILVYEENEAPLSQSVDKLTMQVGWVVACYMITFLIMAGLSFLAVNYLGNFGINTIRPLIWGFNFLIGTVVAILSKVISNKLRDVGIMRHKYVNNHYMTRISGMFFDVMIVAGIAAIDWQDLTGIFWPLLIICVVGGVGTFFYIRYICKKMYPEYEYEAFFSIYGMLTGTASTGMILLREIDPNYETPAATNLIFQQVPAIAFGAPLLLLMSFSGQSFTNAVIALIIFVLMYVIYNVILFRNKIFKKKSKK